jgi:prophage regulatory protein
MLQDPPSSRHKRAPTQTIDSLRIPEALLKIQVVTAVTGRSESTIRRLVADGKFPAPVKDGARCTRWVAGQVSNWLRAKGATQ